MIQVRPAAVSGSFYPRQRESLAHEVDSLLRTAKQPEPSIPKALIAPHAGYIYSGPIAANAYALLQAARALIKRVILLGPAHFVSVRGLAVPEASAFATPLGMVPVDEACVESISRLRQVVQSKAAHTPEHSLEVHLPFLQIVLEKFTLVPLAVGDAAPAEIADVLDLVWGGPETLVVVSSDLSHYLPYETARRLDQETAQTILNMREPVSHHQACGASPVNGLLLAAQRHNLKPQLLDLRNSGDTAGNRSRVVGYAAFAFNESSVYVQ
ncbi:MAG TPA: AmmeMemoRadiSam system protein B [Burkholderiales bacterium]|nr:AmmeMemoRadiSam system protein B [Burkholderiales bacterium]